MKHTILFMATPIVLAACGGNDSNNQTADAAPMPPAPYVVDKYQESLSHDESGHYQSIRIDLDGKSLMLANTGTAQLVIDPNVIPVGPHSANADIAVTDS